MIKTKKIEYSVDGQRFIGFYAYNEQQLDKCPAVLVAHDWSGCNDFAQSKAKMLAELGYVGFAIDMYGDGKIGQTTDEKMELIKPLMEDRNLLQKRILGAVDVLQTIPEVNPNKVGAIGFCFGGLCVLDLARSGADIKGVVSFHGLLNPPTHKTDKDIRAKVLVLHGHDDPMVSPDAVLAFENEMTKAKVDWQLHVYGNTKHAFANPAANDEKLGTVYNSLSEKRALQSMRNFFTEIFSE